MYRLFGFLFCLPILSLFSNSIEMGKHSYWAMPPAILEWGEGSVCKIGNYCSLAEGVSIFLGGEHRTDWVSTYPFPHFSQWKKAKHVADYHQSKGNVIIGNDVWIGYGATILSGVKIGDGAVIGAKAVVAKDVPPYAIVVGNPARVVKYRFTPKQIKNLLSIAWWDWPESEIDEALPYILDSNIDAFIHYAKKRKSHG